MNVGTRNDLTPGSRVWEGSNWSTRNCQVPTRCLPMRAATLYQSAACPSTLNYQVVVSVTGGSASRGCPSYHPTRLDGFLGQRRRGSRLRTTRPSWIRSRESPPTSRSPCRSRGPWRRACRRRHFRSVHAEASRSNRAHAAGIDAIGASGEMWWTFRRRVARHNAPVASPWSPSTRRRSACSPWRASACTRSPSTGATSWSGRRRRRYAEHPPTTSGALDLSA